MRGTEKSGVSCDISIDYSIIGCPALSELGIKMDCQERILFDDAGNVVRCSVVNALKN